MIIILKNVKHTYFYVGAIPVLILYRRNRGREMLAQLVLSSCNTQLTMDIPLNFDVFIYISNFCHF